MFRTALAAVLITGMALSPGRADPVEELPLPRTPAAAPKTPAEKYQALIKAQQQVQIDFIKAYRAAKTDEERKKVSDEFGRRNQEEFFSPAFLAIIKDHPKDPAALDAARWLLNRTPYGPEADEAVAALLRDWIDDPRLRGICDTIYNFTPTGDHLLRAAAERSPHRAVQGIARFTLARSLKEKADRMANQRPQEREPLEREADGFLQEVIDKYADLKHFTTLGQEAEQLRFELRHLAIGRTPPDVEGEDLDGKPLKLSDYRGRVTLVVFWAGWCGPCMADVPHEKEILKRYEGKPFAIIGVNADKNRAEGKAAGEKAEVPWRSFADCKSGNGPIAKRWNVSSWPTLYLLDGAGTIRFKGSYLRTHSVRKNKDGKYEQYSFLDDAVESLMKETDTKP